MNTIHHRRDGITLMEVLIAVGILAIGLSSVVALLPAGHSLAQRSFTTDQASIVAANAAADFVTQGFLRPECLSSAMPPLVYDPLGINGANLSTTMLKMPGLFATSAVAGARMAPLNAYLVRGHDDVVFNVPENPNQDVSNRFNTDGIRDYQGKFTWAALLTRPATSTVPAGIAFEPGDEAILTIVVFHQRDPGQPLVSLGTYSAGTGVLLLPGGSLIAGRKNGDLLRTGAVLALEPASPVGSSYAVRRLSLASLSKDQDGRERAFIEFEGGDPPGTSFTAHLIPDAVAVLERLVTIEGPNGYVP